MNNIQQDRNGDKSTKPGIEFVLLNRNLANYPIARDPRARMDWERGRTSWKCAPEGADFWMMFPFEGKATKRCPTAFDVRLLLMLLRKADTDKTSILRFSSRTQLLRELQVKNYYRNRLRLNAALELWTEITLVFDRWHDPKLGNVEKRLPPPLQISRSELRITIHTAWRELSKIGFRVKVPTALPLEAATQNLVLLDYSMSLTNNAQVRQANELSARAQMAIASAGAGE